VIVDSEDPGFEFYLLLVVGLRVDEWVAKIVDQFAYSIVSPSKDIGGLTFRARTKTLYR